MTKPMKRDRGPASAAEIEQAVEQAAVALGYDPKKMAGHDWTALGGLLASACKMKQAASTVRGLQASRDFSLAMILKSAGQGLIQPTEADVKQAQERKRGPQKRAG